MLIHFFQPSQPIAFHFNQQPHSFQPEHQPLQQSRQPEPSLKQSVISHPSSSALNPFVLTVPSIKTDSPSSVASAALATDSTPATSAAPTVTSSASAAPTVTSSASASNVPFDVSSLKQPTLPKRSFDPAAPQTDFIKQILPSLPLTPGQTPPLPIGANNSFNFHQQLVVLHAQALLLTDAMAKTRQFVEQQKMQKPTKSKNKQNQIQKQFNQLVEHQQRHEHQFVMMLQRQQETMRQNQPHISGQQHQQQQAQFMIYKQLMDNLVRRSQEVGMHLTTRNADTLVPPTANAGDRLSQLQSLIGQRHFDPMQGTPAVGDNLQSLLLDQSMMSHGWGSAPNFQMNTEYESFARNMQKIGGVDASPHDFAAAAMVTGASRATKPQVHSDAEACISLQSQNIAHTTCEGSNQSTAHAVLSRPHSTRPLSFQESIQLNIESQQRELQVQIRLQEQQKSEFQNHQGQIQAPNELHQQKAQQASESSQLLDIALAQSRFKSHVTSPMLLQNASCALNRGALNISKLPNVCDLKKSMNGNAKQRMLSHL